MLWHLTLTFDLLRKIFLSSCQSKEFRPFLNKSLQKLTKEAKIEEAQNPTDLHTEICMRYFTHDRKVALIGKTLRHFKVKIVRY
jgi:hypothetical protein